MIPVVLNAGWQSKAGEELPEALKLKGKRNSQLIKTNTIFRQYF